MKSVYHKTYRKTWFISAEELITKRLENLSYAVSAFTVRPALIPAISMLLGSCLSFYLASGVPAYILGFLIFLISIFMAFRRSERTLEPLSNRLSKVLIGVILFAVISNIGYFVGFRLNPVNLSGETECIRCTVTQADYDLSGGLDMVVSLQEGSLAKVNFRSEIPSDIRQGDSLLIYGKLKEPESAGNPGEFDYKNYLRSQGILYLLSCDRYDVVSKARVPFNITGRLKGAFYKLRKASVEAVSVCFDDVEKALTAAVCVGDKSLISSDVKRDFKLSCCSHLLAVSGTHFAGFLAGLPVMLEKLRINRRKSLIIYSVFAILIGCMTGWSDSVTRAAFMSICCFAMRDWVSAVSLASIVMVIADPFCPLSPGFQMSFCAVIAIKVYSGKISAFLMKLHLGDKLSAILSPAIAASLGMIPFWSDISMRPDPEHLMIQIAGSFVAQLACTFFIPCVVLCMLLPFGSQYLSMPLALCLKALSAIVSFGSRLSESGGAAVHLSKTLLITLSIVVFLFMFPPSILKRLFLKPLTLVLAFLIGLEFFSILNKPECSVVFADVGQGDCCLIITPECTCLIDGGTFEEGASTVCNLLDYYGIYQVDVCIMSHWDTDHAGGIAALNLKGRTKSILSSYVSGEDDSDDDVRDFFEAVGFNSSEKADYLSRLELVLAGDRIMLSNSVYLEVLYPFVSSGGGNEESMVLMLHVDGKDDAEILFTGDIGMSTESPLIDSGIDIDCDILKVAHHGSKYSSSSAFIEACSPEIAVISVGKHNFYGHPAPDTLKRFDSYGCDVFRTDEEGAVIIEYG